MRSIAVKLSGGALCGDSLEFLNSDVRLALGSYLSTTDPGLTFYSANDMTIWQQSTGLEPILQNISQPPISLLPAMISCELFRRLYTFSGCSAPDCVVSLLQGASQPRR